VASLSQKLLPVLQLTRMALVFTALADSGCAIFLWAAQEARVAHDPIWEHLDPAQCISMAFISVGLYGFGMSLNDIIDRRRDRQISPNRPIPSGRIGIAAAHVICAMLMLLALIGGEIYSTLFPATRLSLVLIVFTAGLITFYDFAGKYLVPLGLISLGLIRFFHATIAAPTLPVLWHPLLLLNHVTLLSTVAYHWEQKRPVLKPGHWISVISGLIGIDALAIAIFLWRKNQHAPPQSAYVLLAVDPALFAPAAAVVVFIALAIFIRRRNPIPREAGQSLMLSGLLWLIVYDACFTIGYAGILPGLVIVALLPMAYFSVVVMRWWAKLVVLSQRPAYKRAET
jgi:4-hydroxybenzoate polyprenyltransferase